MTTITMNKPDTSTLRVIYYFVERLNGVLGKTHLQKMLFLTDLLAMKKFKKQITVLEYKKYHYGPFSTEISDYVGHLKSKGFLEEKEFPFNDGSERTYSRFYKRREISMKNELVKDLGPEKVLLLDEVISSYGNLELQEVLDIVYKLELVKNTDKDKPLSIAKGLVETQDEPVDVI